MFNLGGGEILVVLLLALILLGPDKLPEAARRAGEAMAEFRKISNSFKAEMYASMNTPTEPASSSTTVTTTTADEVDRTSPDTASPTPDGSVSSGPVQQPSAEASGNDT